MRDHLDLKRRAALLGSTSLLAATLAFSQTSFAQEAQADDEEAEVEEMLITGSRLTSPNIVSSSPITTIDSELFDVRGTVDTIDLLNTLPQAFAAQTTAFANGANGTSTLDLRGLGSIRTLVLANGKRLPPGSPTPGGFPGDINLIPAPLVERVEIVTGGASAVYGSDAIAGVANFILKRDFEGIEFDAQIGFNQSNNNTDFAQEALIAIGADPVDGSRTDNLTYDISGVFGSSMGDGRGNVTGYFRYFRNNGVNQSERDFSACALGESDPLPFCLGSNQGPFPTTFVVGVQQDANGNPIGLVDAAGNPTGSNSGAFSLELDNSLTDGFTNAFNFNPFNPIIRSVERFNAGFSGYYSLTDTIETYLDFGFTSSNSPQVIAPSAAFGSSINQVNCDNPLLSPTLLAAICGTADPVTGQFSRDVDGDGFAQAEVRRRFVEGGPRTDDRTLTNFRVVGGFRGTVLDHIDWDLFGQFAQTSLQRLQTNQVTFSNLELALDIVADADGNPVCRSALDGSNPDCIPFVTAFDPTLPVDPNLASFVDTPTLTQGTTEQAVFGGTAQADLGNYGISSPLAENGINVLVGWEYRRDFLFTQADGTAEGGDLVGAGAALLPSNGSTQLFEGFFETNIPLVTGAFLAEDLSLTGAYRRSEYSSTNFIDGVEGGDFGTNTFAVGLSWTPVNDYRIRGQFQRAIRAPNVLELFSPVNTGLSSLTDPCSGFAGSDEPPTATAAACANTGVTAAQFGAIPPDSGQLNVITGGDPNLQPEVSDTFTVGIVVTPSAIPGLTVSVDYFNIDVEEAIASIPASFTLSACLDTADPFFCGLINRGTDGSLTQVPRDQAAIDAITTNIGSLSTEGIDIAASYSYDIGNYGSLIFDYAATWLFSAEQTPVSGGGTFDCVGFFDQGCTDPTFDYRHNVTVGWNTPWNIRTSLIWRYFSGVERLADIDPFTGELTTFADEGNGDLLSATLEQQSILDFAIFWEPVEYISFRFGVNNLIDNDPPTLPSFLPSPTANVEANTVAGVYPAAGRFIFFGVNFRY